MTLKQSIGTVVLVAATSIGSMWGFGQYQEKHNASNLLNDNNIFKTASYTESLSADPIDFEKAATKAVPAVVHIRTSAKARQVTQAPDLRNSPATPGAKRFRLGCTDQRRWLYRNQQPGGGWCL